MEKLKALKESVSDVLDDFNRTSGQIEKLEGQKKALEKEVGLLVTRAADMKKEVELERQQEVSALEARLSACAAREQDIDSRSTALGDRESAVGRMKMEYEIYSKDNAKRQAELDSLIADYKTKVDKIKDLQTALS